MSADSDDRKQGLALRLEAMLVREGKEKSRALESKYYGRYGDPANHVEFQSVKAGGLMEDAELKTREVERILQHEIENWIRWGRKRDWLPTGFKCPIGFAYKGAPANYPEPCDERSAVRFERIVVGLPDRHRQAFVMHHLDRAAVRNLVVVVRGRDMKARILAVGKSRYHEIVAQAHNIVLRQAQRLGIL
ncbi:hypothetical protein [Herbaspirillum sp. VT-16-41]|uniref:hypothetical protein n=1 Tax=Herbaspirillum sp. VT-16-41 TaxID=1953765 RepID=UPI000980C674|nr:hypothetical protein [Herbaspirillum sp. VT-16-41]ONN64816.1 hypothetical protein BTM36_22200 [Herbaspirillum sp. VT-16-41]